MTTVYTTRDHDTSLCHSPTEMIEETRYNGWSNYETWNASLWIQNDEWFYYIAKDMGRRSIHPYREFITHMNDIYGMSTTGDGVRWDSPLVDESEMDEMMEEL